MAITATTLSTAPDLTLAARNMYYKAGFKDSETALGLTRP